MTRLPCLLRNHRGLEELAFGRDACIRIGLQREGIANREVMLRPNGVDACPQQTDMVMVRLEALWENDIPRPHTIDTKMITDITTTSNE